MNADALTCVIITFNEEHNIAQCIESASSVSGEVVVVDSESTDKTAEIARKNGAIVLNRPWTGYADARNAGQKTASHDFILAIDADERLSDALKNSIVSLNADTNTIYQIDRLNYFAGKAVYHSGWYPDYVNRLYNRNTAHWEGNLIHETLIAEGVKTKKLSGKLHHYSYNSVKDHNKRIEKYAQLSAQKMHAKGKKYNPMIQYVKAAFRYLRTIIFKRGILDGALGFYIARQNYQLIVKKYNYLKEIESES